MMPFFLPTRPAAFPILVMANETHEEDDDDEEEYSSASTDFLSGVLPIPMNPLSHFVNLDRDTSPIHHDDQGTFCLRMNVDGFQPNELNVSIRCGRLIVRGKHIVQSQPLSTSSVINGNDDTEPDFVVKEFKRTFTIPPNVDVGKAHAQFCPQQQLLVVEIPFQNLSSTRINQLRIRPIDIFLTMIIILSIDRALRITYEQFMINEHRRATPSSH